VRREGQMSDTIRPFRVDVPEEELLDLRRRIGSMRRPTRRSSSTS